MLSKLRFTKTFVRPSELIFQKERRHPFPPNLGTVFVLINTVYKAFWSQNHLHVDVQMQEQELTLNSTLLFSGPLLVCGSWESRGLCSSQSVFDLFCVPLWASAALSVKCEH